jgi:hypothetical protein
MRLQDPEFTRVIIVTLPECARVGEVANRAWVLPWEEEAPSTTRPVSPDDECRVVNRGSTRGS